MSRGRQHQPIGRTSFASTTRVTNEGAVLMNGAIDVAFTVD